MLLCKLQKFRLKKIKEGALELVYEKHGHLFYIKFKPKIGH
jgi:hypothetical protein